MIFEIKYPKYAHNLSDEDMEGTDIVIADETDVADKVRQLVANLHSSDSILVTRV